MYGWGVGNLRNMTLYGGLIEIESGGNTMWLCNHAQPWPGAPRSRSKTCENVTIPLRIVDDDTSEIHLLSVEIILIYLQGRIGAVVPLVRSADEVLIPSKINFQPYFIWFWKYVLNFYFFLMNKIKKKFCLI